MCLQGYVGALYQGLPVNCLINPSLGKEFELDYKTVSKPKSVLIAGINKPNVLTAEDVLLGNVPTGDRIVIAGGGEVGS